MTSVARRWGLPLSPANALFYAADDVVARSMAERAQAVASGRDTTAQSQTDVVIWRLWEGGGAPPAEAASYLDRAREHPDDLSLAAYACLAAVRLGRPDAAARRRVADSLLDRVATARDVAESPLMLSRCHEAAGDTTGALAMLARRPLDPVYGPKYLAGMLYHEGRLALALGDSSRALRAWRHVLVLRDDPEAGLLAQRRAVQRAVDSLSSR